MAGTSEVAEKSGNSGAGGNPIPNPSSSLSFTHTPCYCEENVYFLCKKLYMERMADHMGTDLFVVFISNEEKKIPLWWQKASKRTDGLVIWDYHVICIQSQKNNEGNARHLVWDLDSSLPGPVPLKMYIAEAILPPFPLNPRYSRLFRVVHAPIFLQYFASDRSHMKDPLGNWISPPPLYEPIVAADGTKNNLDEYIQMRVTDISSGGEALTNGVYSNKNGVVISETMLENFFSQKDKFGTVLLPTNIITEEGSSGDLSQGCAGWILLPEKEEEEETFVREYLSVLGLIWMMFNKTGFLPGTLF